jgi:hypothetical protein
MKLRSGVSKKNPRSSSQEAPRIRYPQGSHFGRSLDGVFGGNCRCPTLNSLSDKLISVGLLPFHGYEEVSVADIS